MWMSCIRKLKKSSLSWITSIRINQHLYIRSNDHKAYLEAMELIQEITEQAAVQKVSIFVTVC